MTLKLPDPQFVRMVDGVPCVSVMEHENLMRKAYNQGVRDGLEKAAELAEMQDTCSPTYIAAFIRALMESEK